MMTPTSTPKGPPPNIATTTTIVVLRQRAGRRRFDRESQISNNSNGEYLLDSKQIVWDEYEKLTEEENEELGWISKGSHNFQENSISVLKVEDFYDAQIMSWLTEVTLTHIFHLLTFTRKGPLL